MSLAQQVGRDSTHSRVQWAAHGPRGRKLERATLTHQVPKGMAGIMMGGFSVS